MVTEKKAVCSMESFTENWACSSQIPISVVEQVENYTDDEIQRAVEVFQMLIKWREEDI